MTPTELSTRAEPPRSTPPGAEPQSRGDEAPSGGEGGDGVRVSLTVAPTLNFALEQSGVPLVPMVRIFNDRAAPLHGVRLEVELLPDLGPRHVFAIPPLHGGETAELGPLDLPTPPGRVRAVVEAEQIRLRWCLRGAPGGPEAPEGAVLASGDVGIQLLAFNEWPGFRAPPALLSCFVLPNHPDVGRLLPRVREAVVARSGDPSLDGYPTRSTSRVRTLALGALEAFRSLGLSYIGGAASFEAVGQKVRLPDQIIQEEMGNCLDLSLFVAALLEQLRLAPLLIIVRGHIFLGVWLTDDRFPEGVVGDAARLRSLLGLDELLVFDVTALTAAGTPGVEVAIEAARAQLSDDERFICAIDLRVARGERYLPLPLRIHPPAAERSAGEAAGEAAGEGIEGGPPQLEEPQVELVPLPPGSPSGSATAPADPVRARLRRWSERLLDLSLRNRLLNFRPGLGGALPLLVPDLGRLEDGLSSDRAYELLPRPPSDPRDARDPSLVETRTEAGDLQRRRSDDLDRQLIHVPWTEPELVKRAVELDRAARRDFEEGGANTLFVALGLLKWFEAEDVTSPRYAPLLLLPVRLDFDRRTRRLRLRRIDEEPIGNITLAEKLRRDYAVEMPFLANPEGDEAGVNMGALLRAARAAISRVPRWEVLDEAHLALFTFTRFLMWRDLEESASVLLENAVVRHLAAGGLQAAPAAPPAPEATELDSELPCGALPLVLDADSTQIVAVLAALRGRSFVLQGPPGTGKSQTITNLIAAALAEGKSVLFVSEKMAALDVVHRRLQQVGLGGAVLELHSHKASKKEVVTELGRALERRALADDPMWAARNRELEVLRGQLHGVVRALHSPRLLGLSLHQVGGRLLGLRDAPDVRLTFADVTRIDQAWLSAMSEAVDSLAVAAQAVEPVPANPWRDTRITDWSHGTDEAVRAALEEVREGETELDRALRAVASSLHTPALGSLRGAEVLASLGAALAARPLPPALLSPVWPEIAARATAWLGLHQQDHERRADLAQRWRDELLRAPLGNIYLQFKTWAGSFFLFAWIFLFFPRQSLRRFARGDLPADARITADLSTLRDVQALEPPHEAERAALVQVLEGTWSGDPAALATLLREVEALQEARRSWKAAGGGEPTLLLDLLRADGEDPRRANLSARSAELAAAAGRLRGARSRLEGLVEANLGDPDTADYLSSLRQQVEAWGAALPRFRAWSLYGRAAEGCRRLGLSGIVEAHKTDRVRAADLRRAVERALLQRWCVTFSDNEPLLRTFSGDEQDRRVARFRAIDAALLPLARAQVLRRVEERLPAGGAAEGGEPALLQRELRKQRAHLPLRKLLASIPNLLPRLKPCLLMSPLSVAQYLPASGRRFDLVVFDEASQIGTHEAIGAIARGEQVVIVGDSKQLPPTTFFTRDTAEEALPDENDVVELESILDEALAAGLPQMTLGWHYRSRHESLIAFSNEHSYENKLQIFPAARSRDPELGLHLHPVPGGVYEKGKSRTNRAEAEALVEHLVASLQATRPGARSFGVVTFSMPQQALVSDLLDLARGRCPEIEPHFAEGIPEPVFVKNLENVQGDERDEILFSVCYGPDEGGRVWMNFGPLNRAGGERRLNVAITRARETLRIFATLTADQIDLSRAPAVGARHLQAFLRLAAARGQGAQRLRQQDFPSPFEADLHAALSARGWTVDCQVGTGEYRVDLAVVHPDQPGEYLMAIEGDGPTYRAAATVRDRDRLRPAVLQQLGWRVLRVWSTDLLQDREGTLARVEAALQAALEERRRGAASPEPAPLTAPLPAPPTPSPLDSSREAAAEAPKPSRLEAVMKPRAPVIPYRLAGLEPVSSDPEALYLPAATPLIERRILLLVEAEAPIAVDELYRRVAACWGVSRMTDRVRRRLGEAVATVETRGKLDVIDGFVWAEGQDPEEWTVIRGAAPNGILREPEQIPAEEMAAGALYVLRQNLSLPVDALIRETARLFGLTGRGRRAEERIAAGVTILCDRGRARRVEGRIELCR